MPTMPVGGLVPHAADDAADLIVRNAKIYTGDTGRPHAGALAIRDGLVTAVGD
ncbi:amidohydrolase, partial [Streptomyces sp. 2MCAF27]